MSRGLFQSIASWWKSQDDSGFLDPGPLIDEDLELVLTRKTPGDPARGIVPAYAFQMVRHGAGIHMGNITLRVGNTEDILKYAGHIGYSVIPQYRGNRYAARSCVLLFPLALRHRLNPLWITCNPDNWASRRTCEIVGARLVEIVEIPPYHEFYINGEREKCRYRVDL